MVTLRTLKPLWRGKNQFSLSDSLSKSFKARKAIAILRETNKGLACLGYFSCVVAFIQLLGLLCG